MSTEPLRLSDEQVRDMADHHAAQMERATRGMGSPPLAHEAMRLTIGRLEDGHGGKVLTVEAEVSHVSEDGMTTTWRPCATEGGVRPYLGTTLAGLFTRHALALLLALGLAVSGPALAKDPKPAKPPATQPAPAPKPSQDICDTCDQKRGACPSCCGTSKGCQPEA